MSKNTPVRTLVGDLFESKAQTLVNTVNTVGIMGKGVALEFKKRFPEMYNEYVVACERGDIKLGQPYLFKRTVEPWILNFPTKEHWRSVSRLSDIVAGLKYLKAHYKEWGIKSLAVPPLGCGHGQLEWRVVGPTLFRHFAEFDVPVEIYAPFDTPTEQLTPEFLSSNGSLKNDELRILPEWVALVQVLSKIQAEPHHYPVGRTTFQKIAFFATESGLATQLRFRAGSYGPFADGLKSVETKLVNNGLLIEEKLGRMLHVRPGSTFWDATRAFQTQLKSVEGIVNRITDLFLRMDTNEAEIAATVFYAAKYLVSEDASEADVLNAVKNWKKRRRPALADEDVAASIRHLNLLNWVRLRPTPDAPFWPLEEERIA